MRFLFVHGTGVRRERHDTLFALVRDRLAARFPDAAVDSCFWGERFGATLSAHGRSVPGLKAPDGAPGPGERETAEWGLLLADPLCELRVLAEAGWDTGAADADGGDPFAMPGVRPAGVRVLELLAGLSGSPEALARPGGWGGRGGPDVPDVPGGPDALDGPGGPDAPDGPGGGEQAALLR
ncbi:hypothetical protein J7E97_03680, partial [Streptomyces sp. ISL-66]|nr:hypothetical protein [Streptomyces sp. ISL-66]